MAKVKSNKGKRNRNANLKKIDSLGGFDPDIKGKIIIVIVVLVVLGLSYLLTLYITNKDSSDKAEVDNSSSEAVISYEDIVVGKSFSMVEDEYLIIYYDKSDEDKSSVYSSLVSSYSSKEDALAIYSVDLSSAFNKPFTTTGESNQHPTEASEIAINGPTVIHFSNHEVVDYIEGEEAITSYLS